MEGVPGPSNSVTGDIDRDISDSDSDRDISGIQPDISDNDTSDSDHDRSDSDSSDSDSSNSDISDINRPEGEFLESDVAAAHQGEISLSVLEGTQALKDMKQLVILQATVQL